MNAAGSPADPVTGALLGTAFVPPGLPRPPVPTAAGRRAACAAALAAPAAGAAANTTLVVVATNAVLDPARARRTATGAHAGLARAIDPSHTLVDGDTVFALATGEVAAAGRRRAGAGHAAGARGVGGDAGRARRRAVGDERRRRPPATSPATRIAELAGIEARCAG